MTLTENYSWWSRKLEGKKSSIFAATMLLVRMEVFGQGELVSFFLSLLVNFKYRKYKEFFALCPNFARISAVCLYQSLGIWTPSVRP